MLGKQPQGNLEKQAFDEQLMHDFNMGYLTPATMTPHSSVLFIDKENAFQHPWSIKNVGRQYGYARLKEIIPLNDYLTLPAFLVEDLVEGISAGSEQRTKKELESTPPPLPLTKEEREQMEMMKKAGAV